MRLRRWLVPPAVVGLAVSLTLFLLAIRVEGYSPWPRGGASAWYSLGLPSIGTSGFDLVVLMTFAAAGVSVAAICLGLGRRLRFAAAAALLWFAAPTLMLFEFGVQRATATYGVEVMEEHFTIATANALPWLTNLTVLYVAAFLFDLGVGWACYRALPARLGARSRVLASFLIFVVSVALTSAVYSANVQYANYMWGRWSLGVSTPGLHPIQAH